MPVPHGAYLAVRNILAAISGFSALIASLIVIVALDQLPAAYGKGYAWSSIFPIAQPQERCSRSRCTRTDHASITIACRCDKHTSQAQRQPNQLQPHRQGHHYAATRKGV